MNAIQAKLLALQGRGGDTEIAHLTPGEVVIPRSLQTPDLMRQITALAAARGINPAQLSVGHRANKLNPKTGQREFDMEEIIVPGIRTPPVTIPRFTNMPYSPGSPFGRVGQPSDELAVDNFQRIAANEGYLNPSSIFKWAFEGKSVEELKEIKNTLENIKRIFELVGEAGFKVAAGSLLNTLARLGITILTRTGLPGLIVSIAGGVGVYVIDSFVALLDVMIDDLES